MKRAAWIFLLAVLLPVVTLAALALRAARNERAFLERQLQENARAQVALIVRDAETELAEMQREFMAIYREVDFNSGDAAAVEAGCRQFKRSHPFARLIFVLDRDGTILWTFAPQADRPAADWCEAPALILSGFVSGDNGRTLQFTWTGGTLLLQDAPFDLFLNPTALAAAPSAPDAPGLWTRPIELSGALTVRGGSLVAAALGALGPIKLVAAANPAAGRADHSSRGSMVATDPFRFSKDIGGAILMKTDGGASQTLAGAGRALLIQSAAPAMLLNPQTIAASNSLMLNDRVGSISALATPQGLVNWRPEANLGNQHAQIVNAASILVESAAAPAEVARCSSATATLTFSAQAATPLALPAQPLQQQRMRGPLEQPAADGRRPDPSSGQMRRVGEQPVHTAARPAPQPTAAPAPSGFTRQQQQQQASQKPSQQQASVEAQKFREREQDFLWNRDTITAYLRAEQSKSQPLSSSEHAAKPLPQPSDDFLARQPPRWTASPPQPPAPARRAVAEDSAHDAAGRPAAPARSRADSELRNHTTAQPAPETLPAVTEKIAAEYALNAKPVETRLQPQLPSSTSGFNAPVVAVPASFQDFIALGRHYIPRVTDNRLSLLLYGRDPDVPDRIVGCEVNLDELKSRLQRRLAARGWASDWCAAILDDTLRPVALSLENFTTDFRRPLVSEPLTEALPHWEAAVYSTRPAQLADAARWVSWTVALSVLTCLLVIFIGSLLVWRETARERRLAQQKADFVTNVTHELQTPLANIRLFSEMLGGDAPAEKQRQYSGVLLAETDRLARLINNVLDFAKGGEQRRQTDNCQWIDAGALVREIVETQRPRLENSGFKLTTDFPDASLTIHADREAVTRALVNLISNAEKYGGDPKEIRVTVRQVGNQVEVAVLDRGIGVPAAEREKIFEPFYRAHDQLNSGTSGTGLGLTLARRIARDHGGELRHEPREGGGSVFVLSLPLV